MIPGPDFPTEIAPRHGRSRAPHRPGVSVLPTVVAVLAIALVLASCFDFGENPKPRVTEGVAQVAITSPTDTADVASGETIEFHAEARDENGALIADAFFDWASSVPTVAHIDENGVAQGLSEGLTDIRASSGGVSSPAVTLRVGPSMGPSFALTVQPIFTASCAVSGCHAGPQPQEGMNLEAGQAYDAIVNQRSIGLSSYWRVKPFDPDSSLIYLKVTPECATNCPTGSRMPRSRPPLPADQIERIRAWIAEGALP